MVFCTSIFNLEEDFTKMVTFAFNVGAKFVKWLRVFGLSSIYRWGGSVLIVLKFDRTRKWKQTKERNRKRKVLCFSTICSAILVQFLEMCRRTVSLNAGEIRRVLTCLKYRETRFRSHNPDNPYIDWHFLRPTLYKQLKCSTSSCPPIGNVIWETR